MDLSIRNLADSFYIDVDSCSGTTALQDYALQLNDKQELN